MKDAMDIAKQKRQEHIDMIAQLESEIEELQERIGELESFLDFGEALINGGLDAEDDDAHEEALAPAVEPLRGMSELRSVMAVDDWQADDEDDAAEQSIARVLSARNG